MALYDPSSITDVASLLDVVERTWPDVAPMPQCLTRFGLEELRSRSFAQIRNIGCTEEQCDALFTLFMDERVHPSSYPLLWVGVREPDRATLATPIEDDAEKDRAVGCLLGTMVGDTLGAFTEFKTAEKIAQRFVLFRSFLSSSPEAPYTDDTEMTIALAKSLLECRRVDAAHCAKEYAEFYVQGQRGYGPSVSRILRELHDGSVAYSESGRLVFSEGSFANGGVMRMAPVAVACRKARIEVLREATRLALISTHVHPDAVECAVVQAWLAARFIEDGRAGFLRENDRGELVLDYRKVIAVALDVSGSDELNEKLHIVLRHRAELDARTSNTLEIESDDGIEGVRLEVPAERRQRVPPRFSCRTHMFSNNLLEDLPVVEELVTANQFGKRFQIRATDAVACALWAVVKYGPDPEACLTRVVTWGGDSDTVGAIVCTLLGALHGTAWIPRRWFDRLEQGEWGRDRLIAMARELFALELCGEEHLVP